MLGKSQEGQTKDWHMKFRRFFESHNRGLSLRFVKDVMVRAIRVLRQVSFQSAAIDCRPSESCRTRKLRAPGSYTRLYRRIVRLGRGSGTSPAAKKRVYTCSVGQAKVRSFSAETHRQKSCESSSLCVEVWSVHWPVEPSQGIDF